MVVNKDKINNESILIWSHLHRQSQTGQTPESLPGIPTHSYHQYIHIHGDYTVNMYMYVCTVIPELHMLPNVTPYAQSDSLPHAAQCDSLPRAAQCDSLRPE